MLRLHSPPMRVVLGHRGAEMPGTWKNQTLKIHPPRGGSKKKPRAGGIQPRLREVRYALPA